MTKIRLFGKEYYLIDDISGGPIATKEQWETFSCSYAHLMPDGKIMRFNRQIGTLDDILILEENVELTYSPDKIKDNPALALTDLGTWAQTTPDKEPPCES